MRTSLAALICALGLVAAGCGNDDGEGDPAAADSSATNETESAEPSEEPEPPAVEPDAEYGTSEELRDAAIAAGYDCRRWKQDNVVDLAASSGRCSGEDVFAVFATESDRDAQVDQLRGFAEDFGMEMPPLLVGPNWTINSPSAGALRDQLGGVIFGG